VHERPAGCFLPPAQTLAEAGAAMAVAEAEGMVPPQLPTTAYAPNNPSEKPPCNYQ